MFSQWDPEIEYKSILVLEGGYENYILMYPMDCTNPNVRPTNAGGAQLIDDGQLDDIEYPSLSDITMKEQSSVRVIGTGFDNRQAGKESGGVVVAPPTVDRSSKLAALKTYNSRRDLLKEQNEIAEKLLASQRECLNEEMELAERIRDEEAKRRDDDEDQDDDVGGDEDRINETRFKIMQLDNSIEDAMLRRQEVQEENNRAVVGVPERDSEEASENLRIAASIRQKEEEIGKIRADRERIAREREEKLRLAKEQKRKLMAKKSSGEGKENYQSSVIGHVQPTPQHQHQHQPTTAKAPLIDRSVKPAAIPVVDDVQRDFAPVYGQVVSEREGFIYFLHFVACFIAAVTVNVFDNPVSVAHSIVWPGAFLGME